MNLYLFQHGRHPAALACLAVALCLALLKPLPLAAQLLSSPLGAPAAGAAPAGGPPPAPSPAAGAPAGAGSGAMAGTGGGSGAGTSGHLSAGQGAGVHSPLSPYAPLKPRDDVVAWSVLTDVKTRIENRRIVPVYPESVQALDQKTIRLQGFMMPLGPGEQQRHFLLASVPLTCSFCTPGGPESMVEVRTIKPVKYSMEAVVVEGRFHVLKGDPYGLYYRFTEAVGVPK